MKSIIIILFFFFSINANATIYYVANSGNDANNGTSTSTPWQTLAKVNSFAFAPGDIIKFNGGDIFYGSWRNTHSGTAGNTITYTSYGVGVATITGFTTISSWTDTTGNIWESNSAVSSLATLNMVTINGINYPMGRYPNTGYLTVTSSFGNTSLTCSSLTGTPNWTGGQVVARKVAWITDRSNITGQSGGTLTTSAGGNASYNYASGWGFFIENNL